MTSVTTPFSFRRTASSTAISSKGFMLILTLAMSTPCAVGLHPHLDVEVDDPLRLVPGPSFRRTPWGIDVNDVGLNFSGQAGLRQAGVRKERQPEQGNRTDRTILPRRRAGTSLRLRASTSTPVVSPVPLDRSLRLRRRRPVRAAGHATPGAACRPAVRRRLRPCAVRRARRRLRRRALAPHRLPPALEGAAVIVVACNTATAAAVLRNCARPGPLFPSSGWSRGSPAAALTRNGRVGVMATTGTLTSARYAAPLRRAACAPVAYVARPCPGLARLIEDGDLDAPALHAAAAIARGGSAGRLAWTPVVLGCTQLLRCGGTSGRRPGSRRAHRRHRRRRRPPRRDAAGHRARCADGGTPARRRATSRSFGASPEPGCHSRAASKACPCCSLG